jgi:hypothetical protein
MFVLRSQVTYHIKYIMSRNYSLLNVYVEKHQVEMSLNFQILNYRMLKLVIVCRILNVCKRKTALGDVLFTFSDTHIFGGMFCCHDACIFIYYFRVSCS